MTSQRLKHSLALVAALAFSITTLAVASDASAQSTRVKTRGPAALNVQFKKLTLFKRRGVMTVSYKINKRTWSDLKQARVTPMLALYLPERSNATRFEYAYSVPLTQRKGSLQLPQMNLRGVNDAKVWTVGFGGSYRIATMGIGKTKSGNGMYHLAVDYEGRPQQGTRPPIVKPAPPVVKPRPPVVKPRPPVNMSAAIITACKRNTSYNSGFNKCIPNAKSFRADQVIGVIDACGKATSQDSGFGTCMVAAKYITQTPASVVAACDSASQYDSGLIKCLKSARGLRPAARSSVVKSCGKATSQDNGAITCIEAAKTLNYVREAQVVNACDKHTQYASDLSKCIRLAANRKVQPDALIQACGNATTYKSGLENCIAKATKSKTSTAVVAACGKSTNSDSKLVSCMVQASR